MGVLGMIKKILLPHTSNEEEVIPQLNKHEDLIEEEHILEYTGPVSGRTKNKPHGFYQAAFSNGCECGTSYRYVKSPPYPHKLNCPECGKQLEHYGLLYTADGQRRTRDYMRKNIETEVAFIKDLYETYDGYHSLMCEYANYFCKIKEYEKGIEIGWEVHRRAEKEEGNTGTMPLDIVGMCHRGLVQKFKKEGEIFEAILEYEEIEKINRMTISDKKALEKLKEAYET